jgi:TorA maturation chaperone TorD
MCLLDPQFKIARTRGCIYLLLSRLYAPGFQEKEIRLAFGLLSECIAALPDVFWTEKISQSHLQDLVSDIARAHEDEISAPFCNYYSLLCASQKICPPFESSYMSVAARPKCLASIEEMYSSSGFSDFPSREFPDHISLELQYLHSLSVDEAEAVLNDQMVIAVELRRKQATFLWDHLRSWISAFSKSVQDQAHSQFAALTAKAVDLFSELDAMYLSFLLIKTTDLFTELNSICRSSSVRRYKAFAIDD